MSLNSNKDKVTLEAQIHVNGTPTAVIASSGYFAKKEGSRNLSLSINETLNLSPGDKITIQTRGDSNKRDDINLRSAGTSNILIEKIK